MKGYYTNHTKLKRAATVVCARPVFDFWNPSRCEEHLAALPTPRPSLDASILAVPSHRHSNPSLIVLLALAVLPHAPPIHRYHYHRYCYRSTAGVLTRRFPSARLPQCCWHTPRSLSLTVLASTLVQVIKALSGPSPRDSPGRSSSEPLESL